MQNVHRMKNDYTARYYDHEGELKKKIIYGSLLVLYGVGMLVCGIIIGEG